MREIRAAIYTVVESNRPVTVRQVFYRLVSMGAIKKTEREYQATVCRLLADMRHDGSLPFGWIADNTRWMRKPTTFTSLEDALRRTAQTYRRATWADADVYVEVWLEKDALSGVLFEVTSEWDVPLMVTRGYPSLTFLHSAGEAIAAIGKPTFIYYFGDHDPSGVDIPRNVEAGLRRFAPKVELHFERVAVTPAQIEDWALPTRPTKKTDSRARHFAGESVEVDAIEPARLRELTRACIAQHVDPHALRLLEIAEESERTVLYQIAAGIAANGR